VYHLYAWDVPTGELRQLTDRPSGVVNGSISPNGRSVYYFDDQQGNEIGHFVRVPFEGGPAEDMTPTLSPYSAFVLHESRAGNLLCSTLADDTGFHVYAIEQSPTGELGAARRTFHSQRFSQEPVLSYGGELAVVASTERTGKAQYTLLAVDTATGEQIAELWDGAESSHGVSMFSPVPGDMRVLATTNRSGVTRPLLWSPRTGERFDLLLDELEGDIKPYDWSPDGRRLLLCQFTQAVQHLHLYDVVANTVTRLEHPGGTFRGVTFVPEGGPAIRPACSPKRRTALAWNWCTPPIDAISSTIPGATMRSRCGSTTKRDRWTRW
jgi:WD40 repeat protein